MIPATPRTSLQTDPLWTHYPPTRELPMEPELEPTSFHPCPLCSARTTLRHPKPHNAWDPKAYKYRDFPADPHLHQCTHCFFLSDSRLGDALGFDITRLYITSSFPEISETDTLELLPWSSILTRLSTLSPDPSSVVTLNLPTNPRQTESAGWRYKPCSVRDTQTIQLRTLPLPLYLGSDLDELRRLCRRLGPMMVPHSLRIPKNDSDLFLLKSPPPSCPYPAVTCNPRAQKAKATRSANYEKNQRDRADACPLPPASFYDAPLDALPFQEARNLKSQFALAEARALSVPLKQLPDSVKAHRLLMAQQFLCYLCHLTYNTRLPPHRIVANSNHFGCTLPKSVKDYYQKRSDLAHSPSTRWFLRNPTTINALLPTASYFDPALPSGYRDRNPDDHLPPFYATCEECTAALRHNIPTSTLIALFARLRLLRDRGAQSRRTRRTPLLIKPLTVSAVPVSPVSPMESTNV